MDAHLGLAAGSAAPPPFRPDDGTLSRLYTGLSHEICRPLISLRVGCDLLLAGCEGPVPAEQRCHVQALRSRCDDLIRLTRAYLLDYAGLVQARRPMDWADYRLGALLDEANRQFAEPARARGIAWECGLDGDDAEVTTDLACFQRVLGRLVENALTHTPVGSTLSVRGRVEPGGARWRVDIVDDGQGIPEEAIGRVLEPLVRLSGGRPDAPRGNGAGCGLGLAVCRELVAQLGGELSLESPAEAGTSATVRFPVVPARGDGIG